MYTPSLHSSGDAWHRLYDSAILELDDTKMLSRIAEARTAILDRAEDILTNSSSQERRAINEALHALRVLEAVARKKSAAWEHRVLLGRLNFLKLYACFEEPILFHPRSLQLHFPPMSMLGDS
jgi:hypothetical protein